MTKLWGRLWAAMGVVALLAGGLVSVAAPANAAKGETGLLTCVWTVPAETKSQQNVYWPEDGGNLKSLCNKTFGKPDVENPQFNNSASSHVMTDRPSPDGEISTGDRTVESDEGVTYFNVTEWDGSDPPEGYEVFYVQGQPFLGQRVSDEPVQKNPPPPPCWDASINNCPVGGALRFTAPKYAMVGVPVTMYAYASWRPDANAPAQPTNGTAVIRVDGEDYSGVEFKDGIAEWCFIPETEGMKEFTASGVLFSGLSGANAYIDTVPARTYVLEYDPAAYAAALKKKRVEIGDTYVITDPNQARSYAEDRYEWSVSDKSDDVCAVYETKKGAVKAKFNGEGKCTVIWLDKESEESGKYTFIAKK